MAANESTPSCTDGNIKFETNSNSISARAGFSTVIAVDQLNSEISNGVQANKQIRMNIKPFEPGSFIIPITIEIVDCDNKSLFGDQEDFLTILCQTINEYIQVKMFLQGKSAQKVEELIDSYIIYNSNNEEMIITKATYLLLDESFTKTDINFEHAFREIEYDGSITGVSFSIGENQNVFNLKQSHFHYFSNAERIIDFPDEEQIINEEAELFIIKLSFNPEHKWTFRWAKYKQNINAKIIDESFNTKVMLRKEEFTEGDSLIVNLEYKQKLDRLTKDWIDVPASYKIINVKQHKKQSQTGNLFE